MSKSTTVCLALLISSTAAAADRPKWCSTASDDDKPSGYHVERALRDDIRDALPDLVAETCWPDAEAGQHANELAAARSRWAKELGLVDDVDWADALAWSLRPRSSRDLSIDYPDRKLAFSQYSPSEQLGAIASGVSDVDDPHYIADALGARLTEVGRLGYIQTCLSRHAGPIEWALCQPDIDAFDRKKFASEVKSDPKTKPSSRTALRVFAYEMRPKLAAHAEQVKTLIASDPGYAKMFEIAAAQRQAFATVDPALVALAAAMDDARITNSKRAFEGCDDKVWTAWRGVVGAMPASKFSHLETSSALDTSLMQAAQIIVQEPAGYLSSIALFTCAGRDESDDFLRALAAATEDWPGARGPRTAAASVMYLTGIEFDDRDAKLAGISVHRSWELGRDTDGGSGKGVIAKLTKSGNTAEITFKHTSRKEWKCASLQETNRIRTIDARGQFVYETKCIGEHLATVDTTPEPVTVEATYLDGVKVGAVVEVIGGVVALVWAKDGAPTPSYFAGVKLK